MSSDSMCYLFRSELKETLRFVVEQGADVNVLCKKGNRYWRHENKNNFSPRPVQFLQYLAGDTL